MNYEKHLLKDKRFWPAFWTQFWGAFNDNLFKNAMVILITFKSFSLGSIGPQQMVALCGGVFILPFFLFSAFAGQVADKYPKDKLMVAIKISEIFIMIFGGIGFVLQNIYLLLGVLFLMGLQSTFFGPVKYSILPELINDDELVHGNSLVEMGTFVSILIGTIMGGLLIGMDEVGRYCVAGLVVVFAVIGTFFAKKVSPLEPTNKELKVEIGIVKPTIDIIKIAMTEKGVWKSILGISWFWFLGAALLSIFPVYVKDVIGGDQQIVTLFLALFSIGVAVGSMLCEKLSRERLELGLVPFGSIGMTLFILDLYFVGHPFTSNSQIGLSEFLSHFIAWRVIFDLTFLSVFSGFFIVPLYTYIQHGSVAKVRSRVIAGNNIVNALFMVISSVLLAVLYGLGVTSVQMFLVFGILNAIIAIHIYTVIPEFLLRFFCMILSRMIYRLDVKGMENIPDEGPAVLVCNHVTFVDWLIIAAAVKRPIRFVMHHSFMKIPILKYLFKGAKVIPIAGYTEDPATLEKAFEKISSELRNGELVCIFPEGKITTDGKLNPYRPGIEKIIDKDPVPVIPMVLKGLWGSFFSRMYGKAASKPSIISKTIWSKVSLSIDNEWQADTVSAVGLEERTRELLRCD